MSIRIFLSLFFCGWLWIFHENCKFCSIEKRTLAWLTNFILMELTVHTKLVIYFFSDDEIACTWNGSNHDTSNLLSFVKHPIFCCWKVSHIVFSCALSTHTRPHQQVSRLRKALLAFGNDNFNSFLSRYVQFSYLFKLVMK